MVRSDYSRQLIHFRPANDRNVHIENCMDVEQFAWLSGKSTTQEA